MGLDDELCLFEYDELYYGDAIPTTVAPRYPGNASSSDDYNSNCTKVSTEIYTIEFAFDMFKLAISFIGLIGNFVSILVLTRKNNRNSSTAIYLTIMAVMDSLSLIFHPIRHTFERRFVFVPKPDGAEWICNILDYISRATMCISHWMPVLVTAERVISVKLPLKVKQICMPKSALIITAILLVVLSSVFSYKLFTYDDESLDSDMTITSTCEVSLDIFTYDLIGWVEYTATTLLPLLLVMAGNFTIVCHIIISKRKRAKMSNTRSNRMDKQVLTMLAAISISLFVTSFPYPYMLEAAGIFSTMDITEYMMLVEIQDYLPYINASINFLLFFLSGSRFRAEVKKMFMCSKGEGGVFGPRRNAR